jgi:putative Mg2+ transporter-C (MgtC) family protein
MLYNLTGILDVELALRCLLSCICGFVVGMERTRHQKAAGIRTYIIVAAGATLFTIVSKYGFYDAVGGHLSVDVTRVACYVVTGVGFLGAGAIFMRGNQVQGLTTAAGIWVMAAIGMSIGTGMYVVGILATAIVYVIQTFLGKVMRGVLETKVSGKLIIHMNDEVETLNRVEEVLSSERIDIRSSHIKKTKENMINYTFGLRMPETVDVQAIVERLSAIESVRSIDF